MYPIRDACCASLLFRSWCPFYCTHGRERGSYPPFRSCLCPILWCVPAPTPLSTNLAAAFTVAHQCGPTTLMSSPTRTASRSSRLGASSAQVNTSWLARRAGRQLSQTSSPPAGSAMKPATGVRLLYRLIATCVWFMNGLRADVGMGRGVSRKAYRLLPNAGGRRRCVGKDCGGSRPPRMNAFGSRPRRRGLITTSNLPVVCRFPYPGGQADFQEIMQLLYCVEKAVGLRYQPCTGGLLVQHHHGHPSIQR